MYRRVRLLSVVFKDGDDPEELARTWPPRSAETQERWHFLGAVCPLGLGRDCPPPSNP